MKRLALICALGTLKVAFLSAADENPAEPKAGSPAPAPVTVPAPKAVSPAKSDAPNQDELEAKFKATMTHAVMNGRWCLIKEGQLQPEQEDKYTIVGVNKLFGDNWVVRAGYQFFESPVPDSTFSPTIPDANQNVITIGLGWKGEDSSLELAYGLDFYNDRIITNDQNPALNGKYTFNVHLFSLAYRYSF